MNKKTSKNLFRYIDKSSWKTFRFEEIAKSINERVEPTNTDLEIYVGLEHLDPETIHIKRFGKREEVKGTKLRCYPGDVIFGRRRAYQRKASIVTFDGFCSAHSLVLRANSDVIEPKLFPFFLHSDSFMHRAVDISVGSLSPTINWGTLKEQEFLLPPKDEQAKLAKLLWAADNVVEKDLSVLERLKKLYISLIENKLIHINGKKIVFKKLGKVIRGVSYKPDELIEYLNDESCIILRANNIFESQINYDDIKILPFLKVKENQVLKDGDFIICMSNGSKELVGKSAKYTKVNKNVSIGSFCSCFRPNNLYSERLIEHLFASNSYRNIIKKILTGSNINNLKPDDIENISLSILENENDIKSLLDKLENINYHKNLFKSKLQSSRALLKSLINEIFS